MLGNVAIVALTAGTWYAIKQASATFDRPGLWDRAEVVSGFVGMVSLLLFAWPLYIIRTDGLLLLLKDSIVLGVGAGVVGICLTVMLESEDMIRRPDGLAAPPIRARKNIAVVTDEIREEYPRSEWDPDAWRASLSQEKDHT